MDNEIIYKTIFSKNSFFLILLVISSYIALFINIVFILITIYFLDIILFIVLIWLIISALTLYFESYIHISRSITFYNDYLIYNRPSKLFFFKRKKIKILYSDIDYYSLTEKGIIFYLLNKKYFIYIQSGLNIFNKNRGIIELKKIQKIFYKNGIKKGFSNYEIGYLDHFKAS